MASVRRVVAGIIILVLSVAGKTSAESTVPKDDVSWDKFYILQPCDMDGHPDSRLYQWAILKNIIEGYPDQTLKPDQPVTEAEFLKMLYRGFGIALPTQRFPPGYHEPYDWTDGPYRMAKLFNHPALGLSNPELRAAPITRLHAAEIIGAAQGVHYNGADAATYVIGNNLAVNNPLTMDEFQPDDTITRTEAVQWIRHLTLKGMMKIASRPAEPTDPGLLPDLPPKAAEAVPPFSAVPLTDRDFDLYGTEAFPTVEFRMPKSTVDQLFGMSEETNVFDMNIYPLFSGHFNKDALLDGWLIDHDDFESTTAGPLLRTNKEIVLGESTLFDVLQQYGTYGYIGNGLANYLYEKTEDAGFRPLTSVSYYSQLENPDNVYLLSFLFDKMTLKVTYVMAAWAPYAYHNM